MSAPPLRRFRVYPVVRGQRAHDPDWCWECTLCDPPCRGGRQGADALERIINVSLPRHLWAKMGHHRWVLHHRSGIWTPAVRQALETWSPWGPPRLYYSSRRERAAS